MSKDSDQERLNNAIKQAMNSGAAGELLDALLEGAGQPPRHQKIGSPSKDPSGQGQGK